MPRLGNLIRSAFLSYIVVASSSMPAVSEVVWTAEAAPLVFYDKNVTSGVPFKRFVAGGHEFSVPVDQQASAGWVWGGGASLTMSDAISQTTYISTRGSIIARSSSAWERPKFDMFGDACIDHSEVTTIALSTCLSVSRYSADRRRNAVGMSVRYMFRSETSPVQYYPRLSFRREGGRVLLGSDLMILDVPAGGLIGAVDLRLVSRQKSTSVHAINNSIELTKYISLPIGASRIEASVSDASGTKFLGVDRESRTYHAGIIFMPTQNLNVGFEFDKTIASPDVFSDSGLGITVSFNPLKF